MPKLKNWGGARPGSGRPIVGKEKRQITTIALEPVLLAALERYAKQAGLSRNEAVNRLLSECLLAPPDDERIKALTELSHALENPPGEKIPDWFTSEKPTFEELITEPAPAKFGQWLADNIPSLSPELQSQYKARWQTADPNTLNGLRQYGSELIGAIKAGSLKLHPDQARGIGRMDDRELRKALINLAGITF